MKKNLIFIVLLFSTVNIFSQQDTSLTFNEVMFKTNSGTNSEFIEIYNTSATNTIDLNNFKIKYHTSSADVIVSAGFGTLLPPKSYAVIFEGDYNLSTGIYNGLVPSSALILKLNNNAFGSSGMANSSNRKLILMNSAGGTLDTYTYSANNATNISDEKILTNKDNSSSNWSNSTKLKGTPGFRNSVTPLSFNLVLSSLTTSPLVNLEGNDITINATVKNTGKQTAGNYTIEIYNDTNFDSIGTSSEKIFSQSFTNLLVNDSTTVSTVISNPAAGAINLIAKVIFSNDEDTTNNSKITSLNVFPIQHLFNDIVINEIMYAPSSGQAEWVELYNKTDSLVSIKGWTFSDNKTTVTLTNNVVNIPSKSFIVVSKDSSVLSNYNVPVQLVVFSNMPSLNNSGDAVVVKDSIGILIDSLSYTSSWGGSSGRSLERIDVNDSSTKQSNWGTSININGATPGVRNSITPLDNDLSVTSFTHSPQLIIEGNNVNLSATVKNIGKNTASSFTFNLYNDVNNDNIGTANERIFTQNYSNLAKSDSINVNSTFSPSGAGDYNIIAEIIFATDENTSNNKRVDNFTVIRESNTFNNLVVNEIMYAPPSNQSEWIEIYNRSDSSVNIKNWKIADNSTTVNVTKKDFVLAPKSFVVLSSDSSLLNVFNNSINLLVIPNIPSLNNSGDAVVLHDSLGLKIDSLSYHSSWGGRGGKSLERISVNDSSTKESNWGTSININGATPNLRNSITPLNNDLSITSFTHSPQLIIEGNNVNLSATVKNIGKNTASSFTFNLYNDVNNDNIGTANERIFTQNYSNLAKSDSVNVSTKYLPPASGNYKVLAEIIFTIDDDISNNKSVDNFTVVKETNAFNDIVINEIMYAPPSGQTEWVELYNRTDSLVNIKGWTFADNKTTVTLTNNVVNIPSKSFIVVSKDSSVLSNYNVPVQLVVFSNMPSLNNSGDAVVLHDSLGLKIDSLSYLSSWGGNNGKSLERISVNDSSTKQSNWGTSININGATPGVRNSITPLDNDLSVTSFTHSPQLIIEGNNVNLSATVKNIGKNTAPSFTFNLYNDINNDNIGTANERIFTQNYSNLAKSDSINVNSTFSPSGAGDYNIIAEIIFATDENTSNNKRVDNFTVIRESNTFNNLVVNEIMYAPPSNQSEWIEIYNRSDSSVNIKNWKIADNSTTVNVTKKDFVLAPKSFVVLSSDSSLLNVFNNSINLLVIPNIPSLNNSGDAIVLHDSLGLKIDSLSYHSSWGGSGGRSLERISVNDSSTKESNWGTSININGATPGDLNSITKKDFNIGVTEIIFNPEKPFTGDNITVSTVINNSGKNSVQYSLQLFEDTNLDSLPDKLLETKSNLTINSSETKTELFNFQIINLQNKRNFIVKAILSNDQDTTDNTKEKSIAPGYRQSTIVINEIMFTPINGEPEWIEIYNTASDSINLFHWSITDLFTTPVTVTINENVFIPAKSYLLIARDSSVVNFHKSIPSKIVVINLPGLNNTTDAVILRDNRNLTIDSVLYNSSWGGTNGYSLERKDFSVPSNLLSNWGSSTDKERSTPGRLNSITNRNFDLIASELFFDPQYPVAGDNVTPSLKIINNGQSKANDFSVQFFIDTNSDNIPDQLLSTETNLSLDAFNSTSVSSSADIDDLQNKVLVGAKIIFSQDEDTLNNYTEATTQPGFAHNSLVINEVMYAPETGQPEWIELINNSNETLNLKDWSISDILPSPTKNFITTKDLLIKPDEFIVITKDSSFFNVYPNVTSTVSIVNFGSLGNTSDGIILYDFRDAKIDSLLYSSNWGGGKGFSLERISTDKPTNDSTNWTTSLSVNHSTPGAENSIKDITGGTKGELIINEIMYNPGDGNSEFVEFYNNSSKDVNIGGWKITDENGNENKLSNTSLIIPSKNYFILSADSSLISNYKLKNKFISVLNISSLGLSNAGELILLKDFLGNDIDSVFYSDKWNNSNFTDTKNKSLERINPNINGNDKNNWSTSVNPVGATPGKQNSIFTEKLQTRDNISISPNPFSPDNDGFEDFTIISYNLTQAIAQVKVKIYNSKGRLVRTLDNNLASSSSGSIIFNGLDDERNPLRMGIYIVYLEALNQNDGVTEALKAALVVARKLN